MKRVDGFDVWSIGEKDFGLTGGNVIRNDKSKLLGRLAFPTMDEGGPRRLPDKAAARGDGRTWASTHRWSSRTVA